VQTENDIKVNFKKRIELEKENTSSSLDKWHQEIKNAFEHTATEIQDC
jgi:hypothetical protein